MRNTRVYLNCKFLCGGSRGGCSESGRVGLSPRKGTMEQVLVGGLFLVEWYFLVVPLWKSVKNGLTGKAELVV